MDVQRFALGVSAALQRPRTVPNSRNAVAAKLRFIAGKGVKNCIGKPDTKARVARRRNVQLRSVLIPFDKQDVLELRTYCQK